jgi:uncharacterized protein YecE (DUF72 family)
VKSRNIYIGTSGWHYKHWKPQFYPPEVSNARQFEHYANVFDTVEINNSFYRLPPPQVFADWYKSAPANFIFAVKAPRFFTHMKKLIPETDGMARFFDYAGHLKEKLGPVLFQLPPRWKINTERLRLFLTQLPKGLRFAMEFRNVTWYSEEVYEMLKEFNVAFCIYELDGHISPLIVTADFTYIRLHGPGAKYQGSYTDKILAQWATRIRKWVRARKDVYVYFDNDQEAFAVFNAVTLHDMLTKKK